MPIYVYVCEDGHQFDIYKTIKEIDTPTFCECGKCARRKIVPTMINCDMQPWDYYESPTTGKPIRSYKDRREDMKLSGCVDYDPSMKTEYKKRIQREDKEMDKKVEQTVEKQWSQMDSRKREKLANELLSGADCEIKRL